MNLQVNSFPIIMIEDFCCVHFISPTHTTSYTEKFFSEFPGDVFTD